MPRKIPYHQFVADSFLLSRQPGRFVKESYDAPGPNVDIICPAHGRIGVRVRAFLRNGTCLKCARAATAANKAGNSLLRSAKKIQEKYSGNITVVSPLNTLATSRLECVAECKVHGRFRTSLFKLTSKANKNGCPACGRERQGKERLPLSTWKERAVIGNQLARDYKYISVKRKYNRTFLTIECPKHGRFIQDAHNHVSQDNQCPLCAELPNSTQRRIAGSLTSLGLDVVYNDRKALKGKEIDILLPELALGIEYNGTIWHSERFKTAVLPGGRSEAKWHMADKQAAGRDNGVFIAHFDSSIPASKIINYVLARAGRLPRVYARKSEFIMNLASGMAEEFLNRYHIQGHVKGCRYSGLTHEGDLIGVMAMSLSNSERGKRDPHRWELRRMAFSAQVAGGASKLFKNFIRRTPDIEMVISYSDNRWFTGGVYSVLGFSLVSEIPPDYAYTRGSCVKHKSGFRHSAMRTKKNFEYDPAKTERENCMANGWYRLFDCGKKKWELNLKEK